MPNWVSGARSSFVRNAGPGSGPEQEGSSPPFFWPRFQALSEYARTIRSELQRQSPWQLDITDHSLVTARSRNRDPEVPFVAYLGALFAEQQPNLIVCIGAPAATFVQRHRPQLFANVPMVFTAVDERRVQFSALSKNDAVVPVRIDYRAAFENILQVLPDTENVTVVVGTSPIEQFWMEEIDKAVKPLKNRVSFTWTDHMSFDDLLKHAATLPPRSAIFWELMLVDAAGAVHEGNAALARLHAVSNAPIFSYDEFLLRSRDCRRSASIRARQQPADSCRCGSHAGG